MLLHVTERGDGPPVCLLHGLFGRSQNFGSLARRLSRQFRVLSLDLRNHGASDRSPGMEYAAMAADVLQTLAASAALPVCLLGHSMGGKVAMTAALASSARVTALVVADIAPAGYAHQNARIAAAMQRVPLRPGLPRAEADAALAEAVPDPGVRAFLLQNLAFGAAPAWRIGLDEIAAGLKSIEGWPDLPDDARYDGPTLFVTGGRSDYVQPEHRPVIQALFPQAASVRLDEAGHWLHADQPEAFAACVEAFLLAAPGQMPAAIDNDLR